MDVQDENKTEEKPKPKCFSREWFGVHWKKLIIFSVIFGFIIYIIVDIAQASCTMVEQHATTDFRATCDPVWGAKIKKSNQTNPFKAGFNCKTESDDSWTAAPPAPNTKQCQQASSCINVGITNFLDWITDNVALGVFVFALAYVLATVLFVPGALLTIGAGATFGAAQGLGIGVLLGFLSVWVGASIGALIAFLLGRFLLRDFVAGLIAKFPVLTAVDTAIDKKGFMTVLLLRLSPAVPFNVFNYVMGATKVGFRDYAIATILGIAPGTCAFVFIGAAVGAAAGNLDTDECEPDNTVQYVVLGVGIAATIVAVALISWFAKKEFAALSEAKDGDKDDNDITAFTPVNTGSQSPIPDDTPEGAVRVPIDPAATA